MERIALHQFEDGPILDPSHAFLPGETVYASCRLTGYQVAGDTDEKRSVKLLWEAHAADAAGVAVAKSASGAIEQQVFKQDKDWRPKFLYQFVVPPFAPGGVYKITVRAKDEVGGTELTSNIEFPVRGRDVEPSQTLVARNLRFLPGEQDGPPMAPAVYHPGQTLWARFEITGYKYADKNRYSVEYGLAIEKEDGNRVFAQPAAAQDSSESFYPQRYVPGAVSLNLDANVPAGAYALVILMRDSIGSQMAETRGTFQVERPGEP